MDKTIQWPTDTKTVIRRLKKDRQYDDQMKDRQYNDQMKKDRQYNDQKDGQTIQW
jgi:hypothetical protein